MNDDEIPGYTYEWTGERTPYGATSLLYLTYDDAASVVDTATGLPVATVFKLTNGRYRASSGGIGSEDGATLDVALRDAVRIYEEFVKPRGVQAR